MTWASPLEPGVRRVPDLGERLAVPDGRRGSVLLSWRSPGAFTFSGCDYVRVELDDGETVTVPLRETDWRPC